MWSQWIKSHWPNKSCWTGPTLPQFLYAIWVYHMCCCRNPLALLMLKWLRFPCLQWMTQTKDVVLQIQFYSVMWVISSTLNDKNIIISSVWTQCLNPSHLSLIVWQSLLQVKTLESLMKYTHSSRVMSKPHKFYL